MCRRVLRRRLRRALVWSIGAAPIAAGVSGCFVDINNVVQDSDASPPGDHSPDGATAASDGGTSSPPGCVTTSPCISIPASCVAAPDCACLGKACGAAGVTCTSGSSPPQTTMTCGSSLVCTASAGASLSCTAAGQTCCL